MSEVTDAFAALVTLAGKGSPFRYDQVYTNFTYEVEERRAALVGHGYSIDRTVQVPDRGTDGTVDGLLSFRLIHANGSGSRTEGESLIIRVNLRWTTTSGDEHLSHCFYDIPVAGAALLEKQPEIDTSEVEVLDEGTDFSDGLGAILKTYDRNAKRNVLYGAEWREDFPGSLDDLMSSLGSVNKGHGERNAAYHQEAVQAVRESEDVRGAACVLSGNEKGGLADACQIVTVYKWAQEQPEFAAVV